MRLGGSSLLLAGALCLGPFTTSAGAAPAPAFTISASNVTMPGGSALGTSQFTLTSVNGYAGQVAVDCTYSGGDMSAKVPTCYRGTSPNFNLTANQSAQGAFSLFPYGTAINYARQTSPQAHRGLVLAFLLFGACFLGALRRRTGGIPALLFAAILLAGITSCGGNGLSGTFPYTITATDTKTTASVSASISVTVP